MVGRKKEEMTFTNMTTMTITSVGQMTIPKKMREKYGIENAATLVETPQGILIQKLLPLEERLDAIRAKWSPETHRKIKENAGKTAAELREEIMRDTGEISA